MENREFTQNKADVEKQHSADMNQEAVDRIKQEAEAGKEDKLTPAEADRIEKVFFEDDETVKLRDGKSYKIPPCTLKDARKLMKLLKTVNVDAIILNFIPLEDDEFSEQREQDLYDVLLIAFKGYSHVNREYIDEFVDLDTARKIVEIMIGLNGLKK